MRAARTDKGVHAAGQVCSLKMQVDPQRTYKSIVEEMNAVLPSQIRIWGSKQDRNDCIYKLTCDSIDIIQTSRSFHAKSNCDSRQYKYLLPTFCLEEGSLVRSKTFVPYEDDRGFIKNASPEEMESRSIYRAQADRLKRFNEHLQKYVGSHKFHNFTTQISFDSSQARRFIRSITVSHYLTASSYMTKHKT